jgi:hypothetical protein
VQGQQVVKGDKPLSFEELNQGHGYVFTAVILISRLAVLLT